MTPKGFIITIWKGTESERQFNKAAFEETPVEVTTRDFYVQALVIGAEDVEVNGKGATKYTLETIEPKKPGRVKCISCGHQWDNDDGSGVCPNAANHKDPKGAEMKTWVARQDLKEILDEGNDSIFERKLREWVDENIFENGGENPLENYGTVDRLRQLLDKYGVESEDILVAYRKEIEQERAEKEKPK